MQNAGSSDALKPAYKTTGSYKPEIRNIDAAARILLLHEENNMADVECLRILLDAGRAQFSGLFCQF